MKATKTYNLNGKFTGLNIHFDTEDIYLIKEDLAEKKMISLSSEELLNILSDLEEEQLYDLIKCNLL